MDQTGRRLDEELRKGSAPDEQPDVRGVLDHRMPALCMVGA
jgi:hypothetical protein